MIFSELYNTYYNTMSKILKAAVSGDITRKDIIRIISENAFSESSLEIEPAVSSERWQVITKDLETPIKHIPDMPLTSLQKSWLKAVMNDRRIRLFDIDVKGLEDIRPLFTDEDFRIFDSYADGDPYDDENYISNFRLVLSAIKSHSPVTILYPARAGGTIKIRLIPTGLEYSEKDDKFRLVAEGCRFRTFNMAKIVSCSLYKGKGRWNQKPETDEKREVELEIDDERNAIERVMLHFAHFEKQAVKTDETHALLKIRYYKSDETEMVIRILSFGPRVRVTAPESFVELIRERLISQKRCGLK